jgi:hypothetical protein
MSRHAGLVLTILVLAASPARAIVVWPPATLTPANPTSTQLIQAVFTVPSGCSIHSTTSVVGDVVRTNVAVFECAGGPPPITEYEILAFGPLPPSSYTYEIYYTYETDPPELRSQQPLLVAAPAPAAIPALSRASFAALASALGVAALLMLARSAGAR